MFKKHACFDNGKLHILIPLILSVFMLWSRYSVPGLSADGVTYMQISRNILLKGELGWQALWASPLYSILVAAVSYVTGISDLLAVSSFVSPAMALLLVVAVYKLAEQLFDHTTALVAASIAALSPHLLFISFSTEPEITYTALLVAALALLSKAVTGNSKVYAALSGVMFALAYLSRSEGFLIMAFALLSITAVQGRHFYRSYAIKLSTVATLFFFITAAPYLFFLHKNYGAFVMSPKASYVICWLKKSSINLIERDAYNSDIWGLSTSGRLKWQEPRGIGELASFLMADPGRSLTRYLKNLSLELPGRIPYNSGMENYPQLIPIYLALAALASLLLDWGALQKEKKALLFSPLLIFLVFPVFTSGWWKYLVPYFPVVVVLASKGITGWAVRLAALAGGDRKRLVETAAVSVIVGAIVLSYYLALYPPTTRTEARNAPLSLRANDAIATKQLGSFASKRFGPGKNYMVRWSKLIYYLDGFWTPFPEASHADILGYAKKHKVDYIVYEMRSLEEMAMINNQLPGLELVEAIKSQDYIYMLAFYRLDF
jgi:4-amino-4-deoxy-L-arabinose transferase-like glycosyltransferase